MKLFANITKRDEEQRMVWGYASTEAVDSQGEVVKLDALKGAWDDYMKYANIREMHQPSAVGKCKEYEFDEKGVQIGVKVVDESAWAKVVEGVYTGFSIGGKALNKVDGIIKQLLLTEISLVDRPANPEAMISVFKGEGIPAEDEGVEKGLWTAARMAEVLGALEGVQNMMAYEETAEGEGPALPDELKGHVVELVNLLSRYIGQQAVEIANNTGKADTEASLAKAVAALTAAGFTEEAGEWAAPVEKAGARFSKATKAALAELHADLKKCNERMDKMGYAEAEEDDDDTGKAAADEDLRKMATEKSAVLSDIAKALGMAEGEQFADAISKVLAERDTLKAKVEELSKLPEPPKGALHAVGKAEDAAGEKDTEMLALEKKADEGTLTAADVVKAIHSRGGRPLMV